VIDPLSDAAQRVSTVLQVIRDQLKIPLTLILSPATLIDGESDVPITSYYRFVADSNAMPDSATPKAHFSNLPANHLLTLRMDVPEPWDVQQTKTVQDTDNLRCDLQAGCSDDAHLSNNDLDVPEGQHLTSVEYGLSGLLFFGQCYEPGVSRTNGLQLTLSKNDDLGVEKHSKQDMEVGIDGSTSEYLSNDEESNSLSVYSDTLVMKTVGYWQLRAKPGVWTLKLAEGSRGAEIFEMVEGSVKGGRVSLEKESIGNNSTSKTLVMKDFVSRGEHLLLNRRPGYEEASLFFDKDVSTVTQDEEEEDIVHVFSLATGHLYERFLKIMMLSVTKRTSTKVKFWLFENYLSPTFKASARAMAERIGCEVEFVTYKWPGWLRAQSEKQRIIWGYKILFLDVLFPLNVKKIVSVLNCGPASLEHTQERSHSNAFSLGIPPTDLRRC
jgi:UDP-glucose:glycoprotein glucosyltransferase